MVNTRQRNTGGSGHTMKEFRQLQHQHQLENEEVTLRKKSHRARQVVDEKGIPYVTEKSDSSSWADAVTPSGYTAFKALLTARLCAALWSIVTDCDETYNYWEPTHYLIYGKGFQTWEYDAKYALRSYLYIAVHTFPAWVYAQVLQPNRMYVFYFVRCLLATVCSSCEAYFYIGVSKEVGANVGRITLAFMTLSAGLFVASTAFLPSTTCMYFCMMAYGAWFRQNYGLAIFATALSAFLSWPFSVILGIPIAIDIVFRKKKLKLFFKCSLVSAFSILVPQILLDSDYYGKLILAPLNIVKYNVFTTHGPDLYGTEPWSFYLINGCLNFNLAFVAALLVMPLQGLLHLTVTLPQRNSAFLPSWLSQMALYLWLAVFWMQPHKEERFLFPIYPLICLAAALAVDTTQKLWFFFTVKLKHRHYTEHTQWISFATIATVVVISMLRITALYQNYHAPMDVWMHVSQLSHTTENIQEDTKVNVCIGKEWHRFPSSFFLPNNNWELKFLRSDFKGQLPQMYSSSANATKLVRSNFNDQNLEEPSRYVKDIEVECDFLIDLETGRESPNEPIYSKSAQIWTEETSVDFLDASRSHRLLRAFYIPFLSRNNCAYGRYVLLRNELASKRRDAKIRIRKRQP